MELSQSFWFPERTCFPASCDSGSTIIRELTTFSSNVASLSLYNIPKLIMHRTTNALVGFLPFCPGIPQDARLTEAW